MFNGKLLTVFNIVHVAVGIDLVGVTAANGIALQLIVAAVGTHFIVDATAERIYTQKKRLILFVARSKKPYCAQQRCLCQWHQPVVARHHQQRLTIKKLLGKRSGNTNKTYCN